MEDNFLKIQKEPDNGTEIKIIESSQLSIDQPQKQQYALSIINNEKPKKKCYLCRDGENFCWGGFLLTIPVLLFSVYIFIHFRYCWLTIYLTILWFFPIIVSLILVYIFSWHNTEKKKNILRERLLPN
ncbi:unnamed protein product [Paramecium sonneborni]|uniref:Transmembrane protein n=1 Tax=Paramecium sonneborni TaxID=65129 RepID=A0A8S1P6U8_9CILI|nr:unnamed protein product [Paramecium sonneborni]